VTEEVLKVPRVTIWTGIWAQGANGPFFIVALNYKLESSTKHSYDRVWAMPWPTKYGLAAGWNSMLFMAVHWHFLDEKFLMSSGDRGSFECPTVF